MDSGAVTRLYYVTTHRAQIGGDVESIPMTNIPDRTGHDDSLNDFPEFYRQRFAPMVRLATLLTGQREVARDIVQEALIEVFNRRDDIRNPAAYLRRTVVNASTGFLRSPRNWRHVPLDDHDVSTTPRIDDTFAALATLNPRQRACVVLKFYEGRTEAEIAGLVGCAVGSVGPTMRRALDKLRTELAGDDPAPRLTTSGD